MALPEEPTAAELAEFLRRNDSRHSTLEICASTYESAVDDWTARERREVVAAAKQNKSIRHLFVDVDELTARSAKLISSILVQLGHVREFHLFDSCESDNRPPISAVHTVLSGIVKSGSTIAMLKINSSLSATTLLKLTERYAELEELLFQEVAEDDEDDVGTDRYALAMAVAVAMGRLSSLRKVTLLLSSVHARAFGLLSALHISPTVKTVQIGFPAEEGADELTLQAAFVCACTRTIETVIFRGEKLEDEVVVEVSSLFGIGPVPSFSPSIKEVQFHGCHVDDGDEAFVKRAAKSIENVESLTLFMCHFPFGLQLLERMPRLKKFSFEMEDGNEFFSFLNTNRDVTAFCRIINRKQSLLEDIEIEVQGYEYEPLRALTRLLRSCRGRLVLKLVRLPSESCAHIVRGLERICRDLRELRLRFRLCHFTDQDYANIFRALQSNRTLLALGCDIAKEADDLTISAIHDLVEANDTLQSLTFYELDSETGAAILETTLPVLRSTNRTLRFLGLHETNLAEDWPRFVGPVLEMLEENHVLSGLEGVALPEDDPVALLLKQNRYGRRFLRTNDRSPIVIWSSVLANVSKDAEHGVMYKFLRSKPDLVRSRPVSFRGRRGRKRGQDRGGVRQ